MAGARRSLSPDSCATSEGGRAERAEGIRAVQSIQNFSSGVIAEIIRRQPASKEKTNFAWQLAVGPALARVSNVDLRERILFVTARDDRWRTEIARATPAILAKMQHLLGSDSIHKIRT